MPRCSNCGQNGPTIETIFYCAVAPCRNEISILDDESLEGKDFGVLCPTHRKGLVLTSPTALETELKEANQQLTTTLSLKDRELKDLQAELRALATKLNEPENSSPFLNQITKLEGKLELVKHKLTQ